MVRANLLKAGPRLIWRMVVVLAVVAEQGIDKYGKDDVDFYD